MEVQSIGLAGLEKAQERLAAVAKRLSAGVDGGGVDSAVDVVDLSAEMVALMEAKHAAGVNLKLVETANEMAANAVDILG